MRGKGGKRFKKTTSHGRRIRRQRDRQRPPRFDVEALDREMRAASKEQAA